MHAGGGEFTFFGSDTDAVQVFLSRYLICSIMTSRPPGPDAEEAGATETTISTGLSNLDDALEGGGLRPGTLVVIEADPKAPLNRFLINMIQHRPVQYLTTARPKQLVAQELANESAIDESDVQAKYISPSAAPDAITQTVDDISLDQGGSLVVHSVDPFESRNQQLYADFLKAGKMTVESKDGLGVMVTITQNETENQWLTETFADTIIRLNHKSGSEGVTNRVFIERLNQAQSFVQDTRVFELERGEEMDVLTSRTVNP